jgi:hypothetical protein
MHPHLVSEPACCRCFIHLVFRLCPCCTVHKTVSDYTILLWVDHILLIHSSVDGYLGCGHLLAAVNSAVTSICNKCLSEPFFPVYIDEWDLLCRGVICVVSVLKNWHAVFVPTQQYHFTLPPAVHKYSNF